MAGEQELILELFKEGKEYSTSDVVNAIYSDVLDQDSSLDTKARLHRKLIYHLNKLVEDRVLIVSGYKSKGEKVFRVARDVIVQLPHRKVVLSHKQHSLKGLQLQEESVFEFKPFGIMINALVVNAKNLDLSQLNIMIKELFQEVNDVIAVQEMEHLLATSNLDELNNFFKGINSILNNRKLSLLINYQNPKAHYLGRAYNVIKNNENIEVVLLLKEEDFLSKTKELINSVDALREAGLKINISANGINFSGNAGAYTTKLSDDLISVCSTNSVCIDINKIKALPANKINDLLIKITKEMHQVNAHQQLESEELFPIIKSYSGRLSSGINILRFWNYNWKTDEYLLELFEEAKEEIKNFALNQERIYVSAGMPITFNISLATAFNSFDREKLSSRNYEKGLINNFSDLTNTYADYIKLRNKYFSLFNEGDRLRIFRKKDDTKDILKEFHHLITAKTPYFTYDFRSLGKEINLRDFM